MVLVLVLGLVSRVRVRVIGSAQPLGGVYGDIGRYREI